MGTRANDGSVGMNCIRGNMGNGGTGIMFIKRGTFFVV